jgi:hypothetical protein
LAQRADQLFNESDEGLRHKMLEYVLSNIELKDKKLSYILNDPFRTVVGTRKKSLSAHNSDIWCTTRQKLYTRLALIDLLYRGWKYNVGVIFWLFHMQTIRVC